MTRDKKTSDVSLQNSEILSASSRTKAWSATRTLPLPCPARGRSLLCLRAAPRFQIIRNRRQDRRQDAHAGPAAGCHLSRQALAFRPGHHGMVINISGHEELFIEISSANRRDELLSSSSTSWSSSALVTAARSRGDTVNRERSHALVLRDLSEKITDDPSTTSVASSADSSMLSQQSSDLDTSGDLSHLGGRASLLTFAPTAPLTFTMLTIGSRGDVQPYIALAKGLQADGHNVRIATHAEFGTGSWGMASASARSAATRLSSCASA